MSYSRTSNEMPPCPQASPIRSSCTSDKPCASGLINDIMKKYFCQKANQGSSCSLFSDHHGSVYSMDRRLAYWAQILEDRRRIACRIQRVTGKRFSHVLYNQIEEHRNVQNIKRIIDYAQRLDPTNLTTPKLTHIQDPNVFATDPMTERLQTSKNLEIVGTPKVVQRELWIQSCNEANSSFLTSSVLQHQLTQKTADVRNVLEYFPEIDCLQVVGKKIHKHARPTAELISNFKLSNISSDTNQQPFKPSDFPEYCIQVNDTILYPEPKNLRSMFFTLDFKCRPYERQKQVAFRIRNIGRKPVQMVWMKLRPKGAAYVFNEFPVFSFAQRAFRLTFGDTHKIEVQCMSTERVVRQERYWLKMEPDFFVQSSKIYLRLNGECYIPENYIHDFVFDILDTVLCKVIPSTDHRLVLTETEIFDQLNPGFKCEIDDLKKFKEIYRQIKKKSHPPVWDLNLQTLKGLIEGIPDYTQRCVYLEEFRRLIRVIRRRIPDCDTNIKVLLARGLILTVLDKWETKAVQISDMVAKTEVDALVIKMPFEFVIEQLKKCRTVEQKRKSILHNALYIQMYCSLCELTEEIVTFVENCLLLRAF